MWPIFRFQAVVASGSTYVFAPDTGHDVCGPTGSGRGWCRMWRKTRPGGGRVVGMYKLIANQRDLGAHVANASFMISLAYAGRGGSWGCIACARRCGRVTGRCSSILW